MELSNYALEQMGFRPPKSGAVVSGTFCRLDVYAVRGFTIDVPALDPVSASFNGVTCRFSIGSSVNAICQKLCSDNYTEDEGQWRKDKKCAPPYLVVLFGPTREHKAKEPYTKEIDKSLICYDSFQQARMDLKEMSKIALPRLLSVLAKEFSLNHRVTRFVPQGAAVVGRTSTGTTIHDFRLEGSASAYASFPLEEADVARRLETAAKVATEINPKVAYLYSMGMNESDNLNKFLFQFLSIEIQTHETFKRISKVERDSALRMPPERLMKAANRLKRSQRDDWKPLIDRFVLCSILIWHHLDDEDVDEFARLKARRDNIAHGTISDLTAADVRAAEKLATSLLALR
jgi:hypothetical protein